VFEQNLGDQIILAIILNAWNRIAISTKLPVVKKKRNLLHSKYFGYLLSSNHFIIEGVFSQNRGAKWMALNQACFLKSLTPG
jgi:hypothetical protein